MIWVVGSSGMLGKELCEYLANKNIAFIGTDKECDIADLQVLKNFVDGKDTKWIVNCSAYTAVDKAEDEHDAAFRINEVGAGNLTLIADTINAKIIHISTDYVFGGNGTAPYSEDDPVNPLGVYGRSKLAGELKVKENSKNYFIIRTSWLYGKHGNNFVYTMLRLFNERESLNVVNDQRGCPTWTFNLAEAIYSFIKNDSDKYGVYHYSNSGETTWYDFSREIFNLAMKKGIIHKTVNINPVTSDQYPSKVKRPLYSVLDLNKIASLEGLKLSSWQESLDKFIDTL